MLLVIFGAGASWDCDWRTVANPQHDDGLRLPMTRKLFSLTNPAFSAAFNEYDRAQTLIADLQAAMTRDNFQLEIELEHFMEQAPESVDTMKGLLALQFAFQQGFLRASDTYHRSMAQRTNYTALVSRLESARTRTNEDVVFLTFNYDDLLEKALETGPGSFNNFRDYTQSRFPIFKVHGSVRWCRLSKGTYPKTEEPESMLNMEIIEEVPEPSNDYRHTIRTHEQGRVSLPALAIPTRSKTDFVMPIEHTRALGELVPKFDKVLVIGWAGNDEHFSGFLKAHGFHPKRLLVVSDTFDSAELTRSALVEAAAGPLEHSDTLPKPNPDALPVDAPPTDEARDEAILKVGFTGFIRDPHQLDDLIGVHLGLWPHPGITGVGNFTP